MNELITVIVPVYNAEKYIERCLSSIISQRQVELETIVIDDGSSDNSLHIIKNILNGRCSKIISQENSGVSKARNVGIKNSTGKFIRFVDADDFLPPLSLYTMVKYFSAKTALVVGNSQHYNDFGNSLPGKSNLENKVLNFNVQEGIDNLVKERPRHGVCDKLFLSDKIKKNSIFFHEDVFSFEDLLFVVEYVSLSNMSEVIYIPERIYNYTESSGSATRSEINLKQLTFIDAFERMKYCIKESNFSSYSYLYLKLLITYSVKALGSKSLPVNKKNELLDKYKAIYKEYRGGKICIKSNEEPLFFLFYLFPRLLSVIVFYIKKLI